MTYFIRHWKLIILSLFVSFVVLFIYLELRPKVYMVRASILLNDDRRGGSAKLKNIKNFGMYRVSSNVYNEVEVFKSKVLLENVVRKLGIFVTYYSPGLLQKKEIYGDQCPFTIRVSDDFLAAIPVDGIKLHLDLNPGGKIKLIGSDMALSDVLPNIALVVKPSVKIPKGARKYIVQISNPSSVVEAMITSLDLSQENKFASVAHVKFTSGHPEKAKDIINALMEEYNQSDLKEQNLIADKTVRIIDDRLQVLNSDLLKVENEIEVFKTENGAVDWISEAKLYSDQSGRIEDQLFDVCSQLSCVQNIEKECSNTMLRSRFLPLFIRSDKQSLNVLISEYNELSMTLDQLKRTASKENPGLIEREIRLSYQKEIIQKSLARERENLIIQRNALESLKSDCMAKIESLPPQERVLRSLLRQQSVKSDLYTFLLKKREEVLMNKGLYAPKAKFIDEAREPRRSVMPNRFLLFLLTFLVGLMAPVLIYYLYKKYDFRIDNKAELESITSTSVLGGIPKSEDAENLVLHEYSSNTLIEMFRLLRGNLLFFIDNELNKVLLVTSFQGGEGKTFTSINLALSLAFLKKKVLLIGLDVRKPRISKYLGLDGKEGITSYLSDIELGNPLVRKTGLHENLDYIPAGSIPPNPNELLASKKLDELIEDLRSKYDYLILDTAPVGLVSDTFQLERFADITLFVVRSRYTHRQCVKEADSLFAEGKLKNMCYILNGCDTKNEAYVYGYGKKGTYGEY